VTPETFGSLSHADLVEMVLALVAGNRSLTAKVEALVAEAAAGGEARRPGRQPGDRGKTLKMTDTPDEVVVHTPQVCSGCGGDLADAVVTGVERRQVTDVAVVTPTVTEHRSERRRCGCCGATTAGAFPAVVRAPVSYGPRITAIVVYLLARQHVPVERAAEAARELFGVNISTGTIDAVSAEAGRRLGRFVTALVALSRSLPVIHADETTDRVGTTNISMHEVSTARYTLIHALATRGWEAVKEAGVLTGYRGVVIQARLGLYWRLEQAKHGVCSAHLLGDLTAVAEQGTQRQWASGLAGLLIEINDAADAARARRLETLTPRPSRTEGTGSRTGRERRENTAAGTRSRPRAPPTALERRQDQSGASRPPLPQGSPGPDQSAS